MKVYGISHQGLVRTNNEDSFYYDAKKGILIVADGMGGHAGGEEASRLAVQAVFQQLGGIARQPELTIKNAILAANRVVFSQSAANPALVGMGTTLTLVSVLPDFLITGHIGDSKAFLLDRTGIRCLTSDHSVSGQLLASGKITDAEAVRHPQRHILTRALGTSADIEVEVLRHPWSIGQEILVCSDGLTEVASTKEIFTTAASHEKLEDKVHALLNFVLERGAPDNVTMILAQLT